MPFISRTIDRIRRATDEPSVDAKYSDAILLEYIQSAFQTVLSDISRSSKHKVTVRYDMTLDTDKDVYVVPPSVGQIICIHYLNAAGEVISRIQPVSHHNPVWPGVVFEGNTIRFLTTPPSATTLRFLFVPGFCAKLHSGTGATFTNDTTNHKATVVFPAVPTTGALDKRPQAYAGSIFRITGDGTADFEQDRIITDYDAITRTATLEPEFPVGYVPSATPEYEIAPLLGEYLDLVLALWVARYISGTEGDKTRYTINNQQYHALLRDCRLHEAQWDSVRQFAMRVDKGVWPEGTIGSAAQTGLGMVGRLGGG